VDSQRTSTKKSFKYLATTVGGISHVEEERKLRKDLICLLSLPTEGDILSAAYEGHPYVFFHLLICIMDVEIRIQKARGAFTRLRKI
jgi:hypothetical protein